MNILPSRLKPGDTIGIVSPSDPVIDQKALQAGTDKLTALGFQVKLAKNALSHSLGYAATPQEKADDINALFADPSIHAIFCSQGGQNANSVLPLLDYALITKHPKIFFGISVSQCFSMGSMPK